MREAIVYALAVIGVVVGLALLLAGEAFAGMGDLVPVGGVVALAAVGLLTVVVHRS